MQLYVPTVSCDALNDRPPARDHPARHRGRRLQRRRPEVPPRRGQRDRPGHPAAKVVNNQGLWTVTVSLNADGQQRFTAVTRDLATGQSGQTDQSGQTGHGQLAIVVDATIVSAPAVLAAIPGDLEITGAFTPNQAKLLAAQLSGGELPLVLKPIG